MIEDVIDKGWYLGKNCPDPNLLLNLFQIRTNSNLQIKKHILIPEKTSYARLSLSKIYGLLEYPFHTDGVQYRIPPKFIVLENKSEDSEIASTYLLDGFSLAKENENWFYHSIYFIRGNGFKELSPLINKRKVCNQAILRYNPVIMESIIKKKEVLLTKLLNDSEIIEIKWLPNSFLIIDNWRMLHSRGKVVKMNSNRIINRIEYYIV